jgi:hypothetical protein
MTEPRLVRPTRQAMACLKGAVDEARADLAASRGALGGERNRLVLAQHRLLTALEQYVQGLEAAGCRPHWQLRGEIALLRGVIEGDGPGRRRYRR